MAHRRVTRDECLTLLQAGWTITTQNFQSSAWHPNLRRSVPLAATTITALLRERLIERMETETGQGFKAGSAGKTRCRLRPDQAIGEIRLA